MTSHSPSLWVVLSDTEPDSLGLASKAVALARARGLLSRALLVCPELTMEDQGRMSAAGIGTILHLPADPQTGLCEEQVRESMVRLAQAQLPDAILFLSSQFFCAVAPAVAAALGTGITADCTGLDWDGDGHLLQSRPTFGGRTLATIQTRTLPVIATVRRGVFPYIPLPGQRQAPSAEVPLPQVSRAIRLISTLGMRDAPHDLRRAELIFAGGNGMGTKENFQRLYDLAALTGGQVAASRGAVAAGFAPFSRQVGQTGLTVRPKLYIAFGISGAVQHLSGMMDAECVVAVNPDRNAPIHQVSDYSILTDAQPVISALLDALKHEIDSGRKKHGLSTLEL